DAKGTRRQVPPRGRERSEAGELLDGQRAATMERPLDLVTVVARRPETREVGGDEAGSAMDEPLGPVHREPRPVPEVVRAPQMKVVRRPQDRRIARSERAPGALQFRSADCLAAPDASQVEEARGANHTVERELLHGQSVRIEA